MKKLVFISVLLFAMSLSACIEIKHPQTAGEFRKAVPGAFMSKVDSYVVNQPLNKVAGKFKRLAKPCLDVTVKSESRTHMSYQVIVTNYTPTVRVGKNKAELHLQQKHEKGVMNVSKQPEKGYYLMLFDAVPAGKRKTRITYYGPSSGFDHIRNAVNDWAAGKSNSCPDMTKI